MRYLRILQMLSLSFLAFVFFYLPPALWAQPEQTVPLLSPNGEYRIVFEEVVGSPPKSFVIWNKAGKVCFDAKGYSDESNVFLYERDSVVWNKDGSMLAIGGGSSTKLLLTHVFVLKEGKFQPASVPWVTDKYDNPWVLPVRWLSGRRLVVRISGLHEGRARDHGYQGHATLHFPSSSSKAEVHYRSINEFGDDKSR